MNTTLATTDSLGSYFAQVRIVPQFTKDEEFSLADFVLQDNDKEAAQKIILANLRFVIKNPILSIEKIYF
mgnify:CR=1 FL=1